MQPPTARYVEQHSGQQGENITAGERKGDRDMGREGGRRGEKERGRERGREGERELVVLQLTL